MTDIDITTNPTVEKTFLSMLLDVGSATASDVRRVMERLDHTQEYVLEDVADALDYFSNTHNVDITREFSREGFVKVYHAFEELEMLQILDDIVHAEMVDEALPMANSISSTLGGEVDEIIFA